MAERAGSSSLLLALVLIGALGAPSGKAAAQEARLELRHTGPDTVIVSPGARASVAFMLVNHGPLAVRGRLAAPLPEGWRGFVPDTTLGLAPDSTTVIVVTFFPPEEAEARVYPITLVAEPRGGPPVQRTVYARVPAEPRLDVVVAAAPRWSSGGESYTVTFRVANTGNLPLSVALRVGSPPAATARVAVSVLQLAPRESRDVDVRVTTGADLPRAVTHLLDLQAVAAGDTAHAVARVEIVPQGGGTRGERWGLESDLRLRLSSEPNSGPPVRLRVGGPLREGGSTRVDLLLQGPERRYSASGEVDMYRLAVRNPGFSLTMGDQMLSQSRLTSAGGQGFGLAAEVRAGPVEAGGSAHRDRRSPLREVQYAAFSRVRLGAAGRVGGNWFREEGPQGVREVWTGEASATLPGSLTLEAEIGHRPEGASDARSVVLRRTGEVVGFRVRHLSADSAYGGGYGGVTINSGHLTLRPWQRLHAEGSWEDQNLARSIFSSAVVSSRRSARVAVGYGPYLSFEGRSLATTSTYSAGTTAGSARSVAARAGVLLGPLSVHPTFEFGVGGDSGVEPTSFWRAGLRTQVTARAAALSGSLEYFRGGSLYRVGDRDGVRAALFASLELESGTRVRVSAHGTHYTSPEERRNFNVNGMVEQELPFGHTLSAQVLSRSTDLIFDHQNMLFIVDYSIPFQMPTGPRPGPTAIRVTIRDVETSRPMRGVVVEVGGRRVATDAHGHAVIGGLSPGTHHVDIDRSTGGMTRVANVTLPLTVDVRSGRSTEVEIGLVESATVRVHARLHRQLDRAGFYLAEDSTAAPLDRVVVELTREGERVRRTTGAGGELEIRNLRPGRWSVSVAAATLPPFHGFLNDTVTIDLAPGARNEIDFVAVPRERRTRMVATGELMELDASSPTPRDERRAENAPPASARTITERDPAHPAAPGTTLRTSKSQTTLMTVAREVYLETGLWPKIWVANRDRIPDPDAVPLGTLLIIPPKAPLTLEERAAQGDYYRRPWGSHPTPSGDPSSHPLSRR